MSKRIAIIEDEIELAKNYRAMFQRQGFDVCLYSGRAKAEVAFARQLPDLAVIDIGLGDEPDGGFKLCSWLRAKSKTLPIIILTALDSEIDEVSGLRLGANDYLTKDISEKLLMAHVTALLNQFEALLSKPDSDQVIAHGALVINLDRVTTTWNGEPIDLTMTEFWIVKELARAPGHLKNRRQLMGAAKIVVDDHTITAHIKRIRKKFKAVDAGADPIQTEYAAGYRWRSQIT
jgi:two-component system OmpR family response regulator